MGERVVNGSMQENITNWTVVNTVGDQGYVDIGEWFYGGIGCYVQNWGDHDEVSLSQSVDLTNVSHITFDAVAYASEEGECALQVVIDDDVVLSLPFLDDWTAQDITISGYTGYHTLKFLGPVSPSGSMLFGMMRYISAIGNDLPPAPVAAFTGYPTAGVAPLEVLFTDESTNTPTSWLWSFGDGTLSTMQHPWHTYANPGSYNVNLKATNAGGFGTLQKDGYIVVSTPPASAKLLWKFQFGPS
jgi:uncharacterized membrane protein